MKRNSILVAALLTATMASAQDTMPEITHDSLALDEIIEQYTAPKKLSEVEDESLVDITLATEPAEEGQKYYKNFLGERCLDLGDSKRYYNWKRDITYAGIPLFISSFIIKDKKKAFRSARFAMESGFKTEIDNYTQFAPYAVVVGLKAAGVKGRSDWPRFMLSTALANGIMATAVNATKYSVKEMRPDNSTRNSFPSGHTATAFVAATILHKEYGLTRSPWYSVGAYTVATATGIMRTLNNRHWISDVMAGAGIGILSTELGYFVGDLIMGNRGIQHLEIDNIRNMDHPSFFDVQMGVGLRPGTIEFTYEDASFANDFIDLGTSTSFGVEGAYFINKYLGFGGMMRMTTTPAKALNITEADKQGISQLNNMLGKYTYRTDDGKDALLPGMYSIYIKDNNFTDLSVDLGVYGNLPLGSKFSLGAKLLVGTRFSEGITYSARNGRPKVADYSITDSKGVSYPIYWFEDSDGNQFMSNEILKPGVTSTYNFVLENATDEYDLIKVKGSDAFNFVTGISCTWYYKSNFAWKVFLDFDSAKNKYTYIGNYFSEKAKEIIAKSDFAKDYPQAWNDISNAYYGHASKVMNLLTFGGSFTVTF